MIPVVIIHLNNSFYLENIIQRAIKSNNIVYLISNISLPYCNKNFHIIDINNLITEDNKKFSDLYEHLHIGSKEYELFCFQRWFVLKEFLIKFDINTAFHIDSDVLLFAEAQKEWEKYNQYTMTVTHGCSGASSFFTQDGLEKFTDMLIKIYQDKTYYFKTLVSKFETMKQFGMHGGICDMTLLELFKNNHDLGGGFGRVGEMMQIIDNSTYDHNINVSDSDYATANGIKKIEIIDNKISVYNNRLKKNITFNALHCQGLSKCHIPTIHNAMP